MVILRGLLRTSHGKQPPRFEGNDGDDAAAVLQGGGGVGQDQCAQFLLIQRCEMYAIIQDHGISGDSY